MCNIFHDYIHRCEKVERILEGKSKARVLPSQDCVATLFYYGFFGYTTQTRNFHSEPVGESAGILWHYDTIEAIRIHPHWVYSNNECWSKGFAHCSSIHRIAQKSLPLTTIFECLTKNDYELIELFEKTPLYKIKWDKYVLRNGYIWNLLIVGDKAIVFKSRHKTTMSYKILPPEDAVKFYQKIIDNSGKRRLIKYNIKSIYENYPEIIKKYLGLDIVVYCHDELYYEQNNIEIEDNKLKIHITNSDDRLILQDIYVDGILGHYTGRGNVAKLLFVKCVDDDYKIWDVALVGRDPTGQTWVAHLPPTYWLAKIDACERWVMGINKDDVIMAES